MSLSFVLDINFLNDTLPGYFHTVSVSPSEKTQGSMLLI